MCMYCERRKDVEFGWKQPNLPWHNNSSGINISSNMTNIETTNGVIHDYQTSTPMLVINLWRKPIGLPMGRKPLFFDLTFV